MKELSIEEKAKRYDEAIKKAKTLYQASEYMSGCNVIIKTIFPELAESGDEKMMNQLHSWMKEFGGAEEYTEKVYQWIKGLLKKQGEHARFIEAIQVGDQVTKNEDSVLVNLSQLNRVAKKGEKQGEHKETLCDKCKKEQPSHSCQDITALGRCALEKQGEQKPVTIDIDKMVNVYRNTDEYDEDGNLKGKPVNCMIRAYEQGLNDAIEKVVLKPVWSEEDENTIHLACEFIRHRAISLEDCINNLTYRELIARLKSLKDRVQPQLKQKWSEEDEEIHRKCICVMRASACGFPEEEDFVEQVDNWLKSLKGRVQPVQEWNGGDDAHIHSIITHL